MDYSIFQESAIHVHIRALHVLIMIIFAPVAMSLTFLSKIHVKHNVLYTHTLMEPHANPANLLASHVLLKLTASAVCKTLAIKLIT